MNIADMGLNEWLLIGGTMIGPVLAVQAQKWLERSREKEGRRIWIFSTLMATRNARLSPDHVRALNSIDLTFSTPRLLGVVRRAADDQVVLDAWNEYRRHLNNPPAGNPPLEANMTRWGSQGDELFVNLLERLAKATRYVFDRDQIRSGNYWPQAHGLIELENQVSRKLLLEVLSGQRSLAMDIRSIPPSAARQNGDRTPAA